MNAPGGGGWTPVIVSAAACTVSALAGGLLTTIGPWYKGLKKPSWQPPDWLFGPAWTLIYVGIGTAGVLGWTRAQSSAERAMVVGLFAVNFVLNVAWSYFFFYRRRPDWALLEVGPLWLSILALALGVGSVSHLGGILLIPYLCWVAFAAYLNRTIVRLNGSFA
jgi:tryptophan-rich sensory protein